MMTPVQPGELELANEQAPAGCAAAEAVVKGAAPRSGHCMRGSSPSNLTPALLKVYAAFIF